MSNLSYFSYEGFGERAKQNAHYSQAVRIGDTIEISGQGGWDRLTDAIPSSMPAQIAQAFDNVQHTLASAGSKGWEDVYAMRIYVVGGLTDETQAELVKAMKKHFGANHRPISTGVVVEGLAFGMLFEVEVKAYVGEK